MAIAQVNLGTPPSGEDGDTAREGFTKVNNNFVELDARVTTAQNTADAKVNTSTYNTFVTQTNDALLTKVDKVAGKVLTTNDFTTALLNKLNGIANGATANATDAQLRDRATHTGTQAIGTVTGLQTALDSKASTSAALLKTGGEMTGTLTSSALNSIIQKGGGGKGIIHRVDNANYYFLITDTNDGTFNSLRPFFVNLSTGLVYMRQGLDVSGGLKANSFTGNGDGLTGVKADALTTPRTINGVSFDGTANITLPGTNLGIGVRNTTSVEVTSSTGTNTGLPAATTSLAGLMTSADKTKLDGLVKDISTYGASTSGTPAANLSAVNNTISNERSVVVPPNDYQISALPTNPLGKPYLGEGRLLFNKRLVNPTTDINQNIFGQEYLNPFFEKILDKTASVKVVFSGDSTTENWGQGDYQIDKIFTRIAADKGHVIQAVNKGVGGAYTEEWRTQYLSADLALNPDLYIIRWGLNDVTNGRTIQQYAQSLRSGLQTIRSQRDVKSLAIVLMAPNSTSEYSADRDERWEEQTSRVCRQAARDFGCAFIDTYAIWADSRAGAGVWLDGANGVGGIHPKPVFNMTIASLIADVVLPAGLRPRSLPSSMKTVTTAILPSEYPIGYSLFELTGYDYPATVTTFRSMDGYCSQTIFGHPPTDGWTPQVTTRFGRCDGSNNYWYSKVYDKNGITLAPLNGWSFLAADTSLRAKLSNGVITLNGIITGGTRNDDTLLTTLPVGVRPRNSIICAQASMQTSTGIGTCHLRITSSGEVTIWKNVTAGNGWVSFDGISFEVGG